MTIFSFLLRTTFFILLFLCMLKDKRILITGGTGSLGTELVKMLAFHDPKEIIVLSRDEHKQETLQRKFPDVKCYLGDVRDLQRLELAFHNIDVVVHAAALKIVTKGETDPLEFIQTNIIGSANVLKAAIKMEVPKVIQVSTDKACDPVNLYGGTKFVADKMFSSAGSYNLYGTPAAVVVRYGNVMGSNGSVIPLFMKQRDTITITDPAMTRFMISLEDAAKFIVYAINHGRQGDILVPDLPAMTVKDIADVVAPNALRKTIGIRPGEKMHEQLTGTNESYNSKTARRMPKEELKKWLEQYKREHA